MDSLGGDGVAGDRGNSPELVKRKRKVKRSELPGIRMGSKIVW